MKEATVRTIINGLYGTSQRNVTLWLNKDGTVSLLGNLLHGTTIIVDQKLVDDLQALVNEIKRIESEPDESKAHRFDPRQIRIIKNK